MNLFQKKTVNHSEKKEDFTDSDELKIMSDPEKMVSTGDYNQGKDSYYLDPLLFRRLIEGTSYDRRPKIETEEEITRTKNKDRTVIIPQKSIDFKRMPVLKRDEKKVSLNTNSKIKKFINKERENKLGHIVHEIMGYPKKQNS